MTTHVRIVGTGLIGTSLGIALSGIGFRVSLDDPSPTAMRLARDLGAGELATADAAPCAAHGTGIAAVAASLSVSARGDLGSATANG